MATNATFPPYEYVDGEEYKGIDIEIAQAIADAMGKKLEVDDIDFDSIIPAITTGKADMSLAGMTVTDERKENVDFSDSYATGVQVIIVPEDSDITGPDDLANDKMIGVQQGTTGHIYCSDTPKNGGFGEDHVTAYPNGASAIQALQWNAGKCHYVPLCRQSVRNQWGNPAGNCAPHRHGYHRCVDRVQK